MTRWRWRSGGESICTRATWPLPPPPTRLATRANCASCSTTADRQTARRTCAGQSGIYSITWPARASCSRWRPTTTSSPRWRGARPARHCYPLRTMARCNGGASPLETNSRSKNNSCQSAERGSTKSLGCLTIGHFLSPRETRSAAVNSAKKHRCGSFRGRSFRSLASPACWRFPRVSRFSMNRLGPLRCGRCPPMFGSAPRRSASCRRPPGRLRFRLMRVGWLSGFPIKSTKTMSGM